MAKNIDPNLQKIGEYLKLEKKQKFVIPEYQRAYSWNIEQCSKLWQDILSFLESSGDDPYFFGTIILNCQEDDTKLSLIDGQQRTTTFILLLKSLLLRLNDAIDDTNDDKDSRKLNSALKDKRDKILEILYKADDDDRFDLIEDFHSVEKDTLILNESINELYKSELSIILNNLTFDDIESEVTKIPYRQKDNKYTNFFRNFKYFYQTLEELSDSKINEIANTILSKTEIIEIKSWNVEQAITMFNSLNSDGMPLLDSDIISAKLYSNSGALRDDFNKKWEEFVNIVTNLESSKFSNMDSILMQFMHISRAIDREYISESGAISVTTPGLRRYYTDLNKRILEEPIKVTAKLLKIAKIWNVIQNYSIISLISKFNENIKTYIISYLYKFELDEINEYMVTEFIHEILKIFTVLEIVDTGFSSSKFKTFLFGLNLKLVDKSVEFIEVKRIISEYINREWNRDSIKEDLMEYNKNPLVYLNEYLYSIELNEKFKMYDKYDIEHIMPNSGNNIIEIRKDAGLEDPKEFQYIVNRLGNKIILEQKFNRGLGNSWFRTKIQTSNKEKGGYKDSLYNTPKELVNKFIDNENPLWTVEDINDRTEQISERIVSYIFS